LTPCLPLNTMPARTIRSTPVIVATWRSLLAFARSRQGVVREAAEKCATYAEADAYHGEACLPGDRLDEHQPACQRQHESDQRPDQPRGHDEKVSRRPAATHRVGRRHQR